MTPRPEPPEVETWTITVDRFGNLVDGSARSAEGRARGWRDVEVVRFAALQAERGARERADWEWKLGMEIGVGLREEAERAQRIAERERDATLARAEQAERRLDEAVKALREIKARSAYSIGRGLSQCFEIAEKALASIEATDQSSDD